MHWLSVSLTLTIKMRVPDSRTGLVSHRNITESRKRNCDCRNEKLMSSKYLVIVALRAPLSCTFLQTLPELVTPLKGHSFSITAQLSTDAVSAPPKGWSTNKTESNTASKHARKHEARPPRVKAKCFSKKSSSRFKWFWFHFCWRKQSMRL